VMPVAARHSWSLASSFRVDAEVQEGMLRLQRGKGLDGKDMPRLVRFARAPVGLSNSPCGVEMKHMLGLPHQQRGRE